MTGEKDLSKLLSRMTPSLHDCEYIFCTVDEVDSLQMREPPLMMYREEEGITLILKKDVADELSLPYVAVWSLITLSIHSDLEAVGFIAEVSKHLAKAGISVNVVSAYFHDHLFVPVVKAKDAMDILQRLSESTTDTM